MKRKYISAVSGVILCISLLAFSSESPADWKLLPGSPAQIGKELEIVSIRIGTNLRGRLTGRMCDECKSIRVRINPKTLYYEAPNRPRGLLLARALRGKGAVVVWDVASMTAIRLIGLPDEAPGDENK